MLPVEGEEVDQAGAARGFAGSRQFAVYCNGVECAGFAGIGAAGEGDFRADIRWALIQAGGADQETGAVKRDGFLSQIRVHSGWLSFAFQLSGINV